MFDVPADHIPLALLNLVLSAISLVLLPIAIVSLKLLSDIRYELHSMNEAAKLRNVE